MVSREELERFLDRLSAEGVTHTEVEPGLWRVRPGGAFYAFPNITGTGYSSRELQDQLLNEAGVALVSGTSFGDQGEGYIRFSYANSVENIHEGLRRLKQYLVHGIAYP